MSAGHYTLGEISEMISNVFRGREILLARYGQKCLLVDRLKGQLDELATQFTLDVALAMEFNLDGCYLSPSSHGQKLGNCYSFLYSISSVNILNRNSRDIIDGTYRLIAYNTLQHVKKRKSIELSMAANRPLELLGNIAAQLQSVLQFVHTSVEQKMDTNAFRLECYCSLGRPRNVEYFQNRMKLYAETLTILKLPVEVVKSYVAAMIRALQICLACCTANSLSNAFIILSLYSKFVSGVFCRDVISKKFLEERSHFALDNAKFEQPEVRICLGDLEKFDLGNFICSAQRLFPQRWNIAPILGLLHILELSSYYSNGGLQEACQMLTKHLNTLFMDGENGETVDWRLVQLVSFEDFLRKQSYSNGSVVKKICCKLLLHLADKPQVKELKE